MISVHVLMKNIKIYKNIISLAVTYFTDQKCQEQIN